MSNVGSTALVNLEQVITFFRSRVVALFANILTLGLASELIFLKNKARVVLQCFKRKTCLMIWGHLLV